MRSLLLVNYEYPPLGGGAGNATAQLARELAALDCKTVVLTSRYGDLPRWEVQGRVIIRRIPTVRAHADRCTPWEMATFMASAMAAAPFMARRYATNGTICFFGLPSGPVGLVLKRLKGIPYVVSLRGGDVPGFQPYDLALYHRLARPFIHTIWQEAAAVVANSDGLRDLARRSSPHQRVRVIPNGVDTRQFTPGRKAVDGRCRLLFVGRLVQQKGVDTLLRAVAAAARHRPGLQLSLIGDGPQREELEQLAVALGIAHRVDFAGWFERADLPDRYRLADVFVLPSRDEGMPNVVLEAMASGLPIVASDVPGTRELVDSGVNGALFPAGDTNALAAALVELASEPGLRLRYGAASWSRAQQYDWRQVAMAYQNLFELVVAPITVAAART